MKLTEVTAAEKASGRKALVPFLTAGYPDEATFLELVRTADRAGAAVIEIGIPFSDPMADGPIIQTSSRIALEQGMSLKRALVLTAQISGELSAALVFMSYVNPLLSMGFETFAASARSAGVAGVIIPDLPHEEAAEIHAILAQGGIARIDLLAPTSGTARAARIARLAEGFIYMVSVTGVTGVRSAGADNLAEIVASIRAATERALYVGFGIATPEQAAVVARYADGVIIGSALIRLVQDAQDPAQAVTVVGQFLGEVKRALDEGSGAS